MYISKKQGIVVALIPMTTYISLYYAFVAGNKYDKWFTLFFAFGVILLFFRVLTEAEELTFLDKGTGYYWDEGYCLIPSVAPFLRNFKVNFPWGLRNRRLERVRETAINANIHHYTDQRKPSYHWNVQATPLQADVHRWSGNLFDYILGIDKGKPEYSNQRLGIRWMILAIILGWGANFIYPKTNHNKTSEQFSQLVQVNKGECVKIPEGVTARIAIWSIPTEYTDNMRDQILIESDHKLYEWTWSRIFKEKPIFTLQQIIQTRTITGEGKLCF